MSFTIYCFQSFQQETNLFKQHSLKSISEYSERIEDTLYRVLEIAVYYLIIIVVNQSNVT